MDYDSKKQVYAVHKRYTLNSNTKGGWKEKDGKIYTMQIVMHKKYAKQKLIMPRKETDSQS